MIELVQNSESDNNTINAQNQLKDTRTAINAKQIIWFKRARFRSNARNTGWNPAVTKGECHIFCFSVHYLLWKGSCKTAVQWTKAWGI
jgi:hypothetical protein